MFSCFSDLGLGWEKGDNGDIHCFADLVFILQRSCFGLEEGGSSSGFAHTIELGCFLLWISRLGEI